MTISERIAAAKNKGTGYLLKKMVVVPARGIGDFFTWLFLKIFSTKKFLFDGVTLPYEYNLYNRTWLNERTIEIPIAEHIVQTAPKDAVILEIGNTLKHYYPYDCDVIDKYETAPGVINDDIVEFDPGKKYDLILSISTMEHVGFDEDIKTPGKIHRSLERMAKYLNKGGRMVITMPLGYNPEVDDGVKNKTFPFSRMIFMYRTNARNEWRRVDGPLPWGEIRYGHPFPGGNWLVVGILEQA